MNLGNMELLSQVTKKPPTRPQKAVRFTNTLKPSNPFNIPHK